MIQFHRRLHPVKVISFDLDDTLYDNGPVMELAEQALTEYLHTRHPSSKALSLNGWRTLRDTLAAEDANLAGNMTALRLATLQQGLQQHGLTEADSHTASQQAMQHFLKYRNAIQVAPDVHEVLTALQQRYLLIAISNGNANVEQIGLQPYFNHAWQPTSSLRGKPSTDMFQAAQDKFKFAPHELLHVGDHPVSDVHGAALFGAQSVWLNDRKQPTSKLNWLPTVTIGHLSQLVDILL